MLDTFSGVILKRKQERQQLNRFKVVYIEDTSFCITRKLYKLKIRVGKQIRQTKRQHTF